MPVGDPTRRVGFSSANAARTTSPVSLQHPGTRQIVVGRLGERHIGLPTEAVSRVVRMAALTPLPGSPAGVVGVLDLHGRVLPVVDPRPHFELATPDLRPTQRLVIMTAQTHYAIWMDDVDRVVSVRPEELRAIDGGTDRAIVQAIARLDGVAVLILSPEALDPGSFILEAGSRTS